MLEKLQKLNNQATRDVAVRDGRVNELEEQIKRLRADLEDIDKEQINHDKFIEKELKNAKDEIEHMKEQLSEADKDLDDLKDKIKDQDNTIKGQKDKILQLCEDKVKGNDDGAMGAIDELKKFNQTSMDKFHQLESQNQELVKQNRDLQKQILDDQHEISNLLDQIKDLQAVIDIKDKSIMKMQKHLDLRAKADQGAYSHLVSIKKENNLLKDRIMNKEDVIATLQSSNEKQIKRIINSASLIDRLKNENEKYRSNYKITNSYSPRKHDDLPAVVSTSPLIDHDLVFAADHDEDQPDMRSSPVAKRLDYTGSDRPSSPSFKNGSDTNRKRVQISLGAFFKASTTAIVSDRVVLNKEENSVVLKNTPSVDDKARDRTHRMDAIFTQFMLDGLNGYLRDQLATKRKLVYIIFGQPVNIKLFIVHKIAYLMVTLYTRVVANEGSSVKFSISGPKTIIKRLLDNYEKEASGANTHSQTQLELPSTESDEDYRAVHFSTDSHTAVEPLKKAFLNVLSDINSQNMSFLRLSIVHTADGIREDVIVMLPEVKEMKETVYTHLRDLLLDLNSSNARSNTLDDALLHLELSDYLTKSFFVYEQIPGIDPDTETSMLMAFSDMQRCLATVRTNEQLYV